MQDILAKLKTYFASDYLNYVWWLILLGYLLAYLVAMTLSRAGRAERTVLYCCRRAWGIALVVHLLATTGVAIRWFVQYGYFPSFWMFFPWYLAILLLDIYIVAAALISLNRFASYHQ